MFDRLRRPTSTQRHNAQSYRRNTGQSLPRPSCAPPAREMDLSKNRDHLLSLTKLRGGALSLSKDGSNSKRPVIKRASEDTHARGPARDVARAIRTETV